MVPVVLLESELVPIAGVVAAIITCGNVMFGAPPPLEATGTDAVTAVTPPPPAPRLTVALLIRARSKFPVESYHKSPLLGVEGSPAFAPTLTPGVVPFGLNVCLTPSWKETAPEIVGVTIVGEVSTTNFVPVPV